MNAQLTISGTPEELMEVLNSLNGKKTENKKDTKKKPAALTVVEPDDEEPEITVEELRLLVQAKSKDGHRDAVKKLLKGFGVASVTELGEDNYSEFKEKLEDLI